MRKLLTLLVVTAFSAGLVACGSSVPVAGGQSAKADPRPPPDWFAYDRPAEFDGVVAKVDITARDGTAMNCYLGRPAKGGSPAQGKFPGIVLEYTPYGLETGPAAAGQVPGPQFVTRGYNVLVCDVPGGGQSTDLQTFTPFTERERQANYDLIEWLGTQPFSNGKVGQHGNSYGGMATYRVAGLRPPHLVTITPASTYHSWYLDWNYFGGIKTGADLYQAFSIASTKGRGLFQLPVNYQHPTYDDYWLERDISNKLPHINIPILAIGCWSDFFNDAMTLNYMATKARSVLVMGTEQHACGNHGRLAWYDRYLLDLPAPLPPANVMSYEMPTAANIPTAGGRGWDLLDDWPPTDAKPVRLYLTADNGLADEPGAAGTHLYTVDPFDPTEGDPTGNAHPFPEQTDKDARRLTFTSAPLETDLVLAGSVEVNLRASLRPADPNVLPEGNLVVRVLDVTPEGRSYIVTRGWLKASHFASHADPTPIAAGQIYDFPIHVWAMHWRFQKGHSIRISVTSGDFPKIQPDAPPGAVTVYSGEGGTYADFMFRDPRATN